MLFSMLSIWMHFNGKISNNNKWWQRACKTHSSGRNKIKMLNANWPCWLAGRRRALYPLRGAPVRRRRCIVTSTSATVSNVNFHFSSITTCGEPLSWFGDLGDVAELLLKCQMAASRLFRLGRDHSVAAVSRGGGKKDISSRCQTRRVWAAAVRQPSV